MSQIIREPTAFSLSSTRKKRPRAESQDHLKWIRTLSCVITGRRGCEAAHIRYGDMARGKRECGMAEKPDDKWVVPLHPTIHAEQHGQGEAQWWVKQGIDPLEVALSLWACTGDDEIAEVILQKARP